MNKKNSLDLILEEAAKKASWLKSKLVTETNLSFTKEVKDGRRVFTAINNTSQMIVATGVFGPVGDGFGIEGLTFSEKEFKDGTVLLCAECNFWYIKDDQKKQFPIADAIKMAYHTKGDNSYFLIDEEAHKKLVTSLYSKAFSYLGFNADVFTGTADADYGKYNNHATTENNTPQNKPFETKWLTEAQVTEMADYIAKNGQTKNGGAKNPNDFLIQAKASGYGISNARLEKIKTAYETYYAKNIK